MPLEIQIIFKKLIFLLRLTILKFLSKFTTYFKNMEFNKEELIEKLNTKVKKHYNLIDTKLFTIENANLPLEVYNSNNNFSKIKYSVNYKISHYDKYYFNVYIHCYGNIIEDVTSKLNEINVELSPTDIKYIYDFCTDLSKIIGETIR